MKKYALAFGAAGLLAACTAKVDGEKAIQELTAKQNWAEDSTGSYALAQRLEEAANQAESDSLWARYQLAAGDLESQIPSRALFAIRYYMRVVDSLPQSYGPRALFAVATTFDVNLNDRMRAGQAYEMFLQYYPRHPWAPRVDTLLTITRSGADTLLMQQIQAKKP
ncbi:MAG: hypothetical protein FJX93_02905 [Bacteroidetes bacterium]|nr:hypothetical protein [Bacteroidota bacterium]